MKIRVVFASILTAVFAANAAEARESYSSSYDREVTKAAIEQTRNPSAQNKKRYDNAMRDLLAAVDKRAKQIESEMHSGRYPEK